VITADYGGYNLFTYILGAGVSKWEMVVKVVDNLIVGMSKWEVAVKVAKNFKWLFVKMGSGCQNGT
jgi:hypothetical protein